MTRSLVSTSELAAQLEVTFREASAWTARERAVLLRRLMELRADADVEVNQLRCLQRSVRESPELDAALTAHGFGEVAERDTRKVDAETGALIQAFNHLIEQGWEP